MLHKGKYLIDRIDTPEHVDFSYEIVHSLSSCQGALHFVDASQSMQAQTLSKFRAAQEASLQILLMVTKFNLSNA